MCKVMSWRVKTIKSHSDQPRDGSTYQRCYAKCDMGEYHPYFDTTPDYLNIAAGAAGLGGTARKRCKISSMRRHKPSLVQRKEGLGDVIMHTHNRATQRVSKCWSFLRCWASLAEMLWDFCANPPRNWVLPLKILEGHDSQTFPWRIQMK